MTTSAAPVTSVAASDLPRLVAAANALVAGDKGLLAIESQTPPATSDSPGSGSARPSTTVAPTGN